MIAAGPTRQRARGLETRTLVHIQGGQDRLGDTIRFGIPGSEDTDRLERTCDDGPVRAVSQAQQRDGQLERTAARALEAVDRSPHRCDVGVLKGTQAACASSPVVGIVGQQAHSRLDLHTCRVCSEEALEPATSLHEQGRCVSDDTDRDTTQGSARLEEQPHAGGVAARAVSLTQQVPRQRTRRQVGGPRQRNPPEGIAPDRLALARHLREVRCVERKQGSMPATRRVGLQQVQDRLESIACLAGLELSEQGLAIDGRALDIGRGRLHDLRLQIEGGQQLALLHRHDAEGTANSQGQRKQGAHAELRAPRYPRAAGSKRPLLARLTCPWDQGGRVRWFLLLLTVGSLLVYLLVGPPTQWLGTERAKGQNDPVASGPPLTSDAGIDASGKAALRGREGEATEEAAAPNPEPEGPRVGFRIQLTEVPHPQRGTDPDWKRRPAADVTVTLEVGLGFAVASTAGMPRDGGTTDAQGRLVLGPIALGSAPGPFGHLVRIADPRVAHSGESGRIPWVLWTERMPPPAERKNYLGERPMPTGLPPASEDGVNWVDLEAEVALGRVVKVRWVDSEGSTIRDTTTEFVAEGTSIGRTRRVKPWSFHVLPIPWKGQVRLGYGRRWQGRPIAPQASRPLEIEAPGPPLDLSFEVEEISKLQGTLVRPDGTPATGVPVRVRSTGMPHAKAEARAYLSSTAWDSFELTARTDDTGAFYVHLPKPIDDRFDVAVALDKGGELMVARAVPIGDIGKHEVALYRCTFAMSSTENGPAPWTITVTWRASDAEGTTTGGGHTTALQPMTALEAGDRVEATARADGFAAAERIFTVPEAGGDGGLHFDLEPLDPSTAVRVLLEGSARLPDRLPPFTATIPPDVDSEAQLIAKEAGTFELRPAPLEAFFLSTPRHTGTPQALPAFRYIRPNQTLVPAWSEDQPRTVRLKLNAGGVIRLTVQAAWTSYRPFPTFELTDERGEPIELRLPWQRQEGERWVLIANGRTSLDQPTESPVLDPGRYVLTVGWKGYASQRRIIDVESGKTSEVVITLEKED